MKHRLTKKVNKKVTKKVRRRKFVLKCKQLQKKSELVSDKTIETKPKKSLQKSKKIVSMTKKEKKRSKKRLRQTEKNQKTYFNLNSLRQMNFMNGGGDVPGGGVHCSVEKVVNHAQDQFKKVLQNPDYVEKIQSLTCTDARQLRQIISLYNYDKKVHGDINEMSVSELLETLKNVTQSNCSTEICLLEEVSEKHNGIKVEEALVAKQPKSWSENPKTWLDNFLIQEKMMEFEKAFSTFFFIVSVSTDFCSCTHFFGKSHLLCNVTNLLETVREQKKDKIGVVFNLDTCKGSGTH